MPRFAAVTAVTYALSTDAAASSIALDGLSKFLTFVEKYAVGELISATAPKESEPAFFKLVTTVIKPFLESLKGNSDTMESRAEKYAVFHDFLEISEGFYGDVSSMDDDSQSFGVDFMTALELEWYFETLLGLVINENNAVRQVAISLLTVESQRRVDKVLLHIPHALEGKEEPVLNSLECLVALLWGKCYGLSLIHPIATALEIISSDQTSVVPEFDYIKYLFAPLLRSLVSRKVESGFLYSDFVLVESVGRTFASVIRIMDQREQERVAELVTKTLYLRDVSDLGLSGVSVSLEAHSESNLLIIIFSAVISNLRAEAKVPNADISALLNWLTQEAVTKGAISDQVKAVYLESVYHVVSSVLNKADGSVVSKFVFENAELYKLVENSQSLKVRQSAICLVLWITRATVMKKPSADELAKVTGLIDLLKGSDGGIIASNFYILSADDPSFGKQILTKEGQKLFKHCLPILVDGFNKSDNDLKSNYLLSLSHLMKYACQNLIPLLLAGLNSQNNQLNLTILEIVNTLLSDAPASLQAHLGSFTTRLLPPSNAKNSSTEVRVLALKCLGRIPKTDLPFNELFVLKPKVIRGLQVPLDDVKKSVRKEAGNARAKWFLLLGGGKKE
ncbi:RNAPII transcription regulator C-terminal-domain-containing protein [Obelidium mucronatum]|nr:RNAPII transcription regulator C-terminal-domain-containing protein [Obelidium mucronatum]